MLDHLSDQQMDRYRGRQLSPEELLDVDDHLSSCSQCRRTAAEPKPLHRIIESLESDESDEHLSYETLASLVDDQLDAADREIATVHLEDCALCAGELRELRIFRESESATPTREPFKSSQSFFDRFRARGFTMPRLAAAAILLAVFTTAIVMLYRARQPRSDVVVVPPGSVTPAPSPRNSTTPKPTPEVVASLIDADKTITLDKAGTLDGLEGISTQTATEVRTALVNQRVKLPELETLKGRRGSLMGGSEGVPFELIQPVGRVVRSDRVDFRWQALPGATSYVVRVYDTDFREVAKSSEQATATWRAMTPLHRGSDYVWQVTAIKDGKEVKSPVPPAPEARFRIVSRELENQISQAESAKPRSHLVLGVLYSQAGLIDEAEREFRQLLAANPQSAIAKSFVQQVTKAK